MKLKKYLPVFFWALAGLIFSLLVALVDVKPAGVNQTSLGFADVNLAVREAVGVNLTWYHVSKTMGYIAIALALLLVLSGVREWIMRRDIKKVDKCYFGLAVVFVLLVIFWKAFDMIALNYRPVLENGAAAPSYPSNHTMIGLVIFGSAVLLIRQKMEKGTARTLLIILGSLAALLTVVSRFLAGVHWLTDIIGGILFSALLLCWFSIFIKE